MFFGLDLAKDPSQGYVAQFLSFLIGALWWFVLGALLFEGGTVVSAYFKRGRAPRHVLAVAGGFVALGLLVVGLVQSIRVIFGIWDPEPALPLIYTTIILALILAIATGWSYRTPVTKPLEDSWRH